MNITKEFQEWANRLTTLCKTYDQFQAMQITEAVYEKLQANLSWLFPDMGSADEVLAEHSKNYKSFLGMNHHPDYPFKSVVKHPEALQAMQQYAAQEVAKEREKNKPDIIIPLDKVTEGIQKLRTENESLKAEVEKWKSTLTNLKHRINEHYGGGFTDEDIALANYKTKSEELTTENESLKADFTRFAGDNLVLVADNNSLKQRVAELEAFREVLVENKEAQISGYYNVDKTNQERLQRNCVIEEYKDLIEIWNHKFNPQP